MIHNMPLRKSKSGQDLLSARNAAKERDELLSWPAGRQSNESSESKEPTPKARPRRASLFSRFNFKSKAAMATEDMPPVPTLDALSLPVTPQLPDLTFEGAKLSSVVMGRSRSSSGSKRRSINSPPPSPLNPGSPFGHSRNTSTTSSNKRISMGRSLSLSSLGPGSPTTFSVAAANLSSLAETSGSSLGSSVQHDSQSTLFTNPDQPSSTRTSFPDPDHAERPRLGRSSRASSILGAFNPFKSTQSRSESVSDSQPDTLCEVLSDGTSKGKEDVQPNATRERSKSNGSVAELLTRPRSSSSGSDLTTLFGRRRAGSKSQRFPLKPAHLNLAPTSSPPTIRRTSSSSSFVDLDPFSPSSPFSHDGASHAPVSSMAKPVKAPDAEADESPEKYVQRLKRLVAKAEIARVLSSSSDPFLMRALEAYIYSFDFDGEPIDIALRRLLLDMSLPKETQQIDRVMEAFAKRWHQQNPAFPSSDSAYVLSFSLIMLHTDAFNKHNKTKMTKADYVRNTRIEGVCPALLDYLYDQITHQPFQFLAGVDIHGSKSDGHSSANGFSLPSNRLDVYHAMAEGQLKRLKAGVDHLIPFKNPFSFSGTAPFLDWSTFNDAFTSPQHTLTVPRSASLTASASNNSLVELTSDTQFPEDDKTTTLPVTKIGTLFRKDDLAEGGKKLASRKWKEFSVILAGGQLLFFRDPSWAQMLLSQAEDFSTLGPPYPAIPLVLPDGKTFKPDQILSLADHVAVYDFSYVKRACVFALTAADGSQILFQAANSTEMNQWIGLINYAAAFKTTGIFMRNNESDRFRGLNKKPSWYYDPPSSPPPSSPLPPIPLEELIRPATATKQIYSSAGHMIGSKDVAVDPDWQDETDFKPFTPAQNPLGSLPSIKHTSRSHILLLKISDLDKDILAHKAELRSVLQQAKSLEFCCPLLSASRDRILASIPPLARQIRHLRLCLCRRVAAREILARDVMASERDVARLRVQDDGDLPFFRATASELALPDLYHSEQPLVAHPLSAPMRRRHTDDANLNLSVPSEPRNRTVSSPTSRVSS